MSTPPFAPLPNRDASPVIRGFFYQIESTISRWLELDQSTVLELERGEDIDIVGQALTNRTLEQVKFRTRRVSLRSPEILEVLVRFFLSFNANPALALRFRYLTNAEPAIERGMNFGRKGGGLQVWAEYSAGRLGTTEIPLFVGTLRTLLRQAIRPSSIQLEDWNLFQKLLEESNTEFVPFIERVEWSFGEPDLDGIRLEIEKALTETGYVPLEEIEAAHNQLIHVVISGLSSPGLKRLTFDELRTELRDVRSRSTSPLLVGIIRTLLQDESSTHELNRNLTRVVDYVGQTSSVEALQIDLGLPSLISTVPAGITGGSRRAENADKIVSAVGQTTWIAIHGGSGSGKTELARLVTERVAKPLWISFRTVAAEQMGGVFDSYLAGATRVTRRGDLRQWYAEVCNRLGRGTVIFLDDIPFDANSDICSRIILFGELASISGVKLLSTAVDKISPPPSERLGTEFLEISVPPFSDGETRELCLNHGAPPSLFETPDFLNLVNAVTRRHAQIIAALTRYMKANGWKYDPATITSLIQKDFADDLRLETRRILTATVPESTRELLYRLNVVGTIVTEGDVTRVAQLSPPIALPIDKLTEIYGVWVQKVTADAFQISPLVEQLGTSNVPEQTQKLIHRDKAQSILATKLLNQFDVVSAITHFISAGEPTEAAKVLFVCLNSLDELRTESIEDFGVLGIWTTIEFPTAVSIGLRLILRALQISARKTHSKEFLDLIPGFDGMLEEAMKSDPVSAFGACAMLAVRLADAGGGRAFPYAISALSLEDRVEARIPREVTLKTADIVWLGAADLERPEELLGWLEKIVTLPKQQIARVFASDMAAHSCRFVCDRFWTREADKASPDWKKLELQLSTIGKRAQEIGATILEGAAARAAIVIAADYQKDWSKASGLASAAFSATQSDKRAAFLVAYTIGVSNCDREQWDDAIAWLTRALELEDHIYADFYARALLARAQALHAQGSSPRADLIRAVDFGRANEGVSELMLIRCLGESAIFLWEQRTGDQFFEVWQEVIERILAAKSETDSWKELFLLAGNNCGYFAVSEKGMEPLPNMTRPFQGMYLRYTPTLASLYAPEAEWYIPASMVWLAERSGRFTESSQWAMRAVEMAAGSPIGTDARRLLVYAAPEAIRAKRYSEALLFVAQASEAREAPLDALKAFAAKRDNAEFQKILEARPVQKPSLGSELLTLVLGPILVNLLTQQFASSVRKSEEATSVIETCRELYVRTGDGAWKAAVEPLDQVFSRRLTLDGLIEVARDHSKNGRHLSAFVCFLGTSAIGAPESICNYWLSALSYYERSFSPWRLHIQLMAQYVNEFWRAVLEARPEVFRQPATLGRKLEEFSQRSDLLSRHVMRIVVWHLGLSVPPQAKEWLDA